MVSHQLTNHRQHTHRDSEDMNNVSVWTR